MSTKEGSLGAPTRHVIDWSNPDFTDEKKLDDELRRVFDICHGCRRCFNLCESFPNLFDMIDESKTGELDGVASSDFGKVVDACTMCDMCFLTKCPYVPPHEFNLDFPHLMLRYRYAKRQKNKHSFIDDQLTKTDRNGKTFSKFSNLINWSTNTKNGMVRGAMEKLLKVDKEAELPTYYDKTCSDQCKKLSDKKIENTSKDKVVLFPTCFVNYNNPNLGFTAKRILEKLKIETHVFYEGCCGMPQLEGGDIKSVEKKALHTSKLLKEFIDDGYKVLAIVPSCTLMLKYEWPLINSEDENISLLSKNTYDICEYLHQKIQSFDDSLLSPIPNFNGVTVHISCHSRAQNIGQKANELLKLVPELKVDVIERCSGHGGSWGIKKGNFDLALKVGKPVVRKTIQLENEYLVSECPLAGVHIKQGVQKIDKEKTIKTLSHPIEIIEKSIFKSEES